MGFDLRTFFESALQKTALIKPEEEVAESSDSDMVALIEQAKQEWKQANNYFNNVSDPELVDHAILLREAAERRYMYLLKQAKLAKARAFTWSEGLSTNEPA
ncbi:MAG TPA: DUF2508 family protein [Firmicutes bacterium]|jgi:hypothetical protein|nr:DUF2508 family protein [Bacillota bacterium]